MRKTSLKKDKHLYRVISFDPLKTEKIPNKEYDPDYRTPRKPRFCKGRICFTCLEKNCKHFAFCESEEDVCKHMGGFYRESRHCNNGK